MALTNDTNPGPAVAQTQNFVLGGSPVLVGTSPTSLVGFYGTLPGVAQATNTVFNTTTVSVYSSSWAIALQAALLNLGIIAV